jgi:hypothetical protein
MSEETVAQNTAVGGGSAGLEVEGEPGVYWCARHKSVKTRLRCGRCEKPICPKCTTYGPTGARCRDCVSYKGSHMYQVAPQQYVTAIVTSLALGFVSSYIAAFIGLFAIFYAPVAGTFIGKSGFLPWLSTNAVRHWPLSPLGDWCWARCRTSLAVLFVCWRFTRRWVKRPLVSPATGFPAATPFLC